MPHRTRTLKIGEKVVSMCLLATFQWKKQIKELNDVNAAFRLKEVSTSSLSKIRASKFSEFEVKKLGTTSLGALLATHYKHSRELLLLGRSLISSRVGNWTGILPLLVLIGTIST